MGRTIHKTVHQVRNAYQTIAQNKPIDHGLLKSVTQFVPPFVVVRNILGFISSSTNSGRVFHGLFKEAGPRRLFAQCVTDTNTDTSADRVLHMHSHPGEQVILQLGGVATACFQRFGSTHSEFSVECIPIGEQSSGCVADRIWFRGAAPHLVNASRKGISYRIVFYSTDPDISADHLFADKENSITIDDIDGVPCAVRIFKPAQYWPAYLHAGAAFRRARSQRKIDLRGLSNLDSIDRDNSWLSRFERHAVMPSLEDLKSLAIELGVPLLDILPDFMTDRVVGYLMSTPSHKIRVAHNIDITTKVRTPFLWKEHGLYTWYSGSVGARRLVPMTIYVGDSTAWDAASRGIGRLNARALNKETNISRFGIETCIYCEDGVVDIAISKLPWSELLTPVAESFAQCKSDRISNEYVEICRLRAGDIIHIRSGYYPCRILSPSNDSPHAKLFCILRRGNGSGSGLSLPALDENSEIINTAGQISIVPSEVSRNSFTRARKLVTLDTKAASAQSNNATANSNNATMHIDDENQNPDSLRAIFRLGEHQRSQAAREDSEDRLTEKEISYLACMHLNMKLPYALDLEDQHALLTKLFKLQMVSPRPHDIVTLHTVINILQSPVDEKLSNLHP